MSITTRPAQTSTKLSGERRLSSSKPSGSSSLSLYSVARPCRSSLTESSLLACVIQLRIPIPKGPSSSAWFWILPRVCRYNSSSPYGIDVRADLIPLTVLLARIRSTWRAASKNLSSKSHSEVRLEYRYGTSYMPDALVETVNMMVSFISSVILSARSLLSSIFSMMYSRKSDSGAVMII